jgi:P pilus assembly chaperone PapD
MVAQTNTGLTFSGQDISCISTVWSPTAINGKQLTANATSTTSFYFPSDTSPDDGTSPANFTHLLQGQLLTINNQTTSSIDIYTWVGGPQIQIGSNYYADPAVAPANTIYFTITGNQGMAFILTGGTYWVRISTYVA